MRGRGLRGVPGRVLLLFDIDGTLVLTGRAGITAMQQAARELFGEDFSFEGIPLAGRLDGQIWGDAARRNGVDPAEEPALRQRYFEHLSTCRPAPGKTWALPGSRAMVAQFHEEDGIDLGILSGNYPECGRYKLSVAGFDPAMFRCNAWGSDAGTRRDLPPVAMECYRQLYGKPISPGEIAVIGDTPADIDCARNNGCLSIAVATGPAHDIHALEAAGPDILLVDLSSPDALLEKIRALREARA